MKRLQIITWLFSFVYGMIPVYAIAYGGQVPGRNQVTPSSYELPDFLERSFQGLCKEVDFPELPKMQVWRKGKVIDEGFLSNPASITRKHLSVGKGNFKDKTWFGGICIFSCDRLVKNPEPFSNDELLLLSDLEKGILTKAAERKVRDPNFDEKEFVRRHLEGLRKSKENIVSGSLDVRICNAPTSKAAIEYLLVNASLSDMPVQLIAAQFSESNRLHDLGTVGFHRQWKGFAKTMFVRDNIAVIIRARGELANEALPLARKIDA